MTQKQHGRFPQEILEGCADNVRAPAASLLGRGPHNGQIVAGDLPDRESQQRQKHQRLKERSRVLLRTLRDFLERTQAFEVRRQILEGDSKTRAAQLCRERDCRRGRRPSTAAAEILANELAVETGKTLCGVSSS